ncbi:MAG: hypothetical protein RSC24_06475 [Clostridium sp.]
MSKFIFSKRKYLEWTEKNIYMNKADIKIALKTWVRDINSKECGFSNMDYCGTCGGFGVNKDWCIEIKEYRFYKVVVRLTTGKEIGFYHKTTSAIKHRILFEIDDIVRGRFKRKGYLAYDIYDNEGEMNL